MKRKSKKIWRKNFAIKNCHYQMATPCMFDTINYQYKITGKKIVDEIIWVQEGDDLTGCYIPVKKLKQIAKKTVKVIANTPNKVKRIHKRTKRYNKDFYDYIESIRKTDFSKLENKKLLGIYEKIIFYTQFSHGMSIATTWFVDCEEVFSIFLKGILKDIAAKKHFKMNIPKSFSILTTPYSPSFSLKEEMDALKLILEIKKNKKAHDLFQQNKADYIEENLDILPKKIKNAILKHYNDYCWLPYVYTGPAYDLNYYIETWSLIIKQDMDVKKELEKLEKKIKETKESREHVFKDLKIDKNARKIFDIAAEIVFLKTYRKDCLFHGIYIMDFILKEIAKRFALSLKQVRFMSHWEVEDLLADKKDINVDVLNERMKFSVYHQKNEKGVIYTGQRAKKFLKKFNFEKEKIVKTNTLKGSTATPGKVKGVARIINLPNEMRKMNKGDIMVSHSTFPSLVPAMKKAAAIVTDDGGITCHAAIVARELKIPCVVGTKIATQVLKDGDILEVDASRGTVRIAKKKKRKKINIKK